MMIKKGPPPLVPFQRRLLHLISFSYLYREYKTRKEENANGASFFNHQVSLLTEPAKCFVGFSPFLFFKFYFFFLLLELSQSHLHTHSPGPPKKITEKENGKTNGCLTSFRPVATHSTIPLFFKQCVLFVFCYFGTLSLIEPPGLEEVSYRVGSLPLVFFFLYFFPLYQPFGSLYKQKRFFSFCRRG